MFNIATFEKKEGQTAGEEEFENRSHECIHVVSSSSSKDIIITIIIPCEKVPKHLLVFRSSY